jgi:hypothetical protein
LLCIAETIVESEAKALGHDPDTMTTADKVELLTRLWMRGTWA